MNQRSGKGAAKRKGTRSAGRPGAASKSATDKSAKVDAADARAELTRTISELNEVQMRLDAILRRMVDSADEVSGAVDTASDLEALRLRLHGKLDRMRERLVTRLGEDRKANVR